MSLKTTTILTVVTRWIIPVLSLIAVSILNEFSVALLFSNDGALSEITLLKLRAINIFLISVAAMLFFSRSIRTFVGSIIQEFIPLIMSYRLVATVILLGAFGLQVLVLVNAVHLQSSTSDIVSVQDFESGKHVSIVSDASWFKDHNVNHYGPLYFRLARSFSQAQSPAHGLAVAELLDVQLIDHYALQLVSVISFFMICVLLSQRLGASITQKASALFLVTWVLLSNDLWINQIFRAQPDMLLALCVLVTFILLWRTISTTLHQSQPVILAGFSAGLGLLAKLSFLPYLVIGTLALVSQLGAERTLAIKRGVLFILVASTIYVVVGFPVTFHIERSIDFLMSVNTLLVKSSSFESVKQMIMKLMMLELRDMLWMFLIGLLVGSKCPVWQTRNLNVYVVSLSLLAPLILLLSTNYIGIDSENHFLPIMGLLNYFSLQAGSVARSKIASALPVGRVLSAKIPLVLVMLALSLVMFKHIPETVNRVSVTKSIERDAILRSARKISFIMGIDDELPRIIAEDAVLLPQGSLHDERVDRAHLNMTLSKFQIIDPDIIILNTKTLPYIMDGEVPNAYFLIDRQNYKEIRAFYELFYANERVEHPVLGSWEVIFYGDDGIQIWEKSGTMFSRKRALINERLRSIEVENIDILIGISPPRTSSLLSQ